MMHEPVCVFDDYVTTSDGTVYSGIEHQNLLSRADQISLMVVLDLDSTTVTAPPTLQAWLDHSGNGRDWAQKNAVDEVVSPFVGIGPAWGSTPGTYVLWGGEAQPLRPSHPFVRVAIQLNSTQAHFGKITATVVGRHQGRRLRAKRPPPPLRGDLRAHLPPSVAAAVEGLRAEQHVDAETASHFRDLEAQARDLPEGERLDHVLFHLGAHGQQQLEAFGEAVRRLPRHVVPHLLRAVAAEGLDALLGIERGGGG